MRRISVHGEISATAYKKIKAKLFGLSKKAILTLLDNDILHALNEDDAKKILKTLENLTKTADPITAEAEATGFELPAVESDDRTPNRRRFQSTAILKEADLKANKDRLDLMYDVNYFSYLHPDVMKPNAEALLAFAKSEKLTVSSHWNLFAVRDVFLELEEDGE